MIYGIKKYEIQISQELEETVCFFHFSTYVIHVFLRLMYREKNNLIVKEKEYYY